MGEESKSQVRLLDNLDNDVEAATDTLQVTGTRGDGMGDDRIG
jgi:hypothetical protein